MLYGKKFGIDCYDHETIQEVPWNNCLRMSVWQEKEKRRQKSQKKGHQFKRMGKMSLRMSVQFPMK